MKTTLHCGLALLLLSAASLSAGTIASSTFDANDEGWRVGELLGTTGSPATPTHNAAGGNPGGFIRTGDIFVFNAYLAPSAFLGNWTALGVASVSFDLRLANSDGTSQAYLVIASGATEIATFGLPPANNTWTTFSFQTTSNTGWFFAGDGVTPGAAVSAAQFASIMSNVTALRIDADWLSGPDQVDLDNVILSDGQSNTAVPEPSLGFFAGALSLAGVYLHRRRR